MEGHSAAHKGEVMLLSYIGNDPILKGTVMDS